MEAAVVCWQYQGSCNLCRDPDTKLWMGHIIMSDRNRVTPNTIFSVRIRMCNCGARRRAAAGPRSIPTVTAPPPPVPRSVPAPAPAPAQRFNRLRQRHFGRPAPPPEPAFHLPIVDTKVWGPRLWTVLHVASVAIPCADVWPRLVEELKMGLPCPDCTAHYTAWATAQPVTATTDMSAWFLALHNDVNRRIGSASAVRAGWTCEQLTATYTGQLAAGRTALDAVRGVIGEAAWTTLDAVLVAAVTAVPVDI